MTVLRYCVALILLAGLTAGEIKNKGWWRHTVFYQIYPRSFMDGNNDGIGDLSGITSKLEHFRDTGIGAIWLSPIFTSPMVDFGYDISDFRDIEESYGTMAEFEDLTSKAKKLGIKVILDLVPNHSSDKHEWFQKSVAGIGKYKDYYIWKNGKNSDSITPPNNWISVFSGPAWRYNADRKMWYLHQFEYRQPDLNYANKYVQEEMKEIIRFWLDKGVDGFRVDAVPFLFERDDMPDEPLSNYPGVSDQDYSYLNHVYTMDDPRTYALVQSWRDVLDEWADTHNADEKVMLTEAYTSLENTTRYYTSGSHVPFNFDFIVNVHSSSSAEQYKTVIDDWIDHTPEDAVPNWVMGNHDQSRSYTRYPGRGDQMIMLEMILPGIAVTYYGEEIGMEDKLDISWEETQDPQACNTDEDTYKSKSRDPNRTPFQWDSTKNAGFSNADVTWIPVHENYMNLNLQRQRSEAKSHYNLYKSLILLRNSSSALKTGSLMTKVLNDGQVLGVARQKDLDVIILMINFENNKSTQVDARALLKDSNAAVKSTVIHLTNVDSSTMWNAEADISKLQLQAKESVVLQVTVSSASGLTPTNIFLSISAFVTYILFK